MELKNNNILKYLKYAENSLNSQLEKIHENETIQNSLNHKLDSIIDIREKINFQLKSSSEKQAFRIEWIASLRKRKKPVDSKLSTIKLYSKILEVIPYLKVLNRNEKIKEIENICQKEIDLIDFSGRNFGDTHVSFDIIKELFHSFFQSKNDFPVHPEAISKISELFEEFENTLNN